MLLNPTYVISFWSCPLERGGTGFVQLRMPAGSAAEAGRIGRAEAVARGWRYIESGVAK